MLKRIFILAALLTLASPALAGFDEGKKAYDSKNWKAAVQELRPLAEQGDDRAMVLLGTMYNEGYGVVPSHQEALRLFRRAVAEKNNVLAMDALGAMYVSAIGVDQNLATALQWFKRSALLGDQKGAFFYATILFEGNKTPPNALKPDIPQAYKWFKIAEAEQQSPVLQRVAARMTRGILAQALLTEEAAAALNKEAAAWKPVEASTLGPSPETMLPLPPESPDKPLPHPGPTAK